MLFSCSLYSDANNLMFGGFFGNCFQITNDFHKERLAVVSFVGENPNFYFEFLYLFLLYYYIIFYFLFRFSSGNGSASCAKWKRETRARCG